jgi:hypothetical protein
MSDLISKEEFDQQQEKERREAHEQLLSRLRQLNADLDEAKKEFDLSWRDHFDERELRLMRNCIAYAQGDPAGMPGHNLAIIIAKMCEVGGFEP